jgi:hypothetical protein
MNLKKSCLLFATSALAITLLSTGCASTGNHAPVASIGTNGLVSVLGHDIQPQAMGQTLKVASQAGTMAALRYDKNSRSYLQAAEVIFDAALHNGTYDPAVLSQSLASISVKEARDPQVTAGIESAFGLYGVFFGTVVTAKINDVSPYAVPALTGLRDGIAAGLLLSPQAPAVIPTP